MRRCIVVDGCLVTVDGTLTEGELEALRLTLAAARRAIDRRTPRLPDGTPLERPPSPHLVRIWDDL